MNKRAIATIFTLFILIFTTGCTITPKYQVTIDAISAPNTTLQPSTYELKALDKNKDSNSLRFQQYATPLAQILHEKGYLKVTGAERPQQTIYFDYGIEKLKEERRTYIEPDIISFGFGFGYPYGAFGYYDPFYHHPIYYGSRYHTYTSTYYNRYITILAKDYQSAKELWRVDVSSVGESKNLRKIIPLLIEASKPYIGTTTKEPVELVIKEEKR